MSSPLLIANSFLSKFEKQNQNRRNVTSIRSSSIKCVAHTGGDSRRSVMLSIVATPALFFAQQALAGDVVTDLVKTAAKIENIVTKPDICDKKACKIYPASDGEMICRLYRPKGTEYMFNGEVLTQPRSGKFVQVDCETVIEKIATTN
mmetsp:Transcript_33083/g.45860  ORF Transcript_33083/g.45860 Transcript_33083/m.45860 type:complete len:148 (+) Transcript_33083:74-517(+)